MEKYAEINSKHKKSTFVAPFCTNTSAAGGVYTKTSATWAEHVGDFDSTVPTSMTDHGQDLSTPLSCDWIRSTEKIMCGHGRLAVRRWVVANANDHDPPNQPWSSGRNY